MMRKPRSRRVLVAILAVLSVAVASVAYAAGQGGGTSGPDQLRANGDGTVTDLSTHLVWQQQEQATHFVEPDAVSYCSSLTLAGKHDWRLPTIYELQRLVDYSAFNPASAPQLSYVPPDQQGTFYTWSSTPVSPTWGPNYSGYYWMISFGGGDARTAAGLGAGLEARCVRG